MSNKKSIWILLTVHIDILVEVLVLQLEEAIMARYTSILMPNMELVMVKDIGKKL